MNMTVDKWTNMFSVTLSSLKYVYLWLQRLIAIIVSPSASCWVVFTESENFRANISFTDKSSKPREWTSLALGHNLTRFVSGKVGPNQTPRLPLLLLSALVGALCGLNFPCWSLSNFILSDITVWYFPPVPQSGQHGLRIWTGTKIHTSLDRANKFFRFHVSLWKIRSKSQWPLASRLEKRF